MKPDGVATAAMEPMDAREGAGPVCEEPATPPEVKKSAGEGKPPGDKTKSAKSGDTKAKAKGSTRAKASTNVITSTKASVTSPRPSPAANRVVNGVQKQPASNGVPKKTAPPASEKKKLAPAPAKKSVSPTKPAEKKTAAARPTSAPGAAGMPSPKKKAPAVTSNDAKAKPKTAAPRPTSGAPAKSSTGAAAKPDKPAVSMATRPAAGPPPRAAPAASTGKLASSSARPGPVKTSVPSAGKASTMQSPKPPTPAKKDVSRSTSTVAKKPTESPGRPSAAKTSKSESPKPVSASKSDAPNKRPVSSTKPADSKPTRPKPQEVKASTSPRPAGSKPGVSKSASPKKAVGSSTPMPVKRTPKPTPPVSAAEENLLQKAAAASVSDTTATASQVSAAEPNVGHALQREEAVELPQAADLAQEETKVANVSTPRMEDSQDLVVLSVPEVASLAQSPPSSTPASLSLQAQSASPVVEPVIAHDDTSSKDQPPMTTAEDSVEYEPKIQPHVESTPQVSASIDQLAMISPIGETDVAVEKADEEINVDNDEDEEYEEKDDEDEKHKKKECGIQLSDMSMPQTMENFLKSDDLDLDTKDINGQQEELMNDPPVFLEETAILDDQEEVSLMGKDNESTGDTTYNSRIAQHTCVMQLEKEDGQQEEEEEEEDEEKQWEEKEQQKKQQEEEELEEEEEKHQSEEEQEKEQQQVEEEKKEEKHLLEEEQEKEQQVEEKKEEKHLLEEEQEKEQQVEEKKEEKHQSEEEQEKEQQVEEKKEEKDQSEEEQEKEQQVEEKKEEKHQSEEEQEMEQQQVEEEEEEKQRVEQEVEFSLQLPEVCSSQPMEKFPAETNCSGFQGPMRTDLELDADHVHHDDDGEDDDSNDDEDDDYVKGSQQEVQHHSTFDLLETTERTLSSMEARVKGKECEIFDAPSHHSELLPDIAVEKRREEEENDTQELERKRQPIAEYLSEFTNLASCTAVQGLSNPVIDATNVNDCHHGTQILSTPDLLGALERTSNQEKASLMEMEDKLIDTLSQHNDSTPQIPLMEEEETEEAQFSLQMSEMSCSWQMEEFPAKSVDLISCVSAQSPSTVDMGNEDLSKSHIKTLEQDIAILPEDVDGACILGETNLKEEEGAVVCSVAHRYNSVQETPEKHEEQEDDDDDDDDDEEEEEADQQDDMDVGSERAENRQGVPHEDEEEDEDVEMASEVVTEGRLESYENVVEDDHAEGEHCLYNLNLTPSLPPVSSGPWDQLPLIAASQPLDQSLEPVLPAQPAWLDLGNTLRKEEPLLQASDKSPLDEVSRPVMPECQLSSLGDAQQVAHCSSGSETGTPEELADYDSSSGVESRSEDKQRTPVLPAQPDIEQDLGIHLEKGDVEGEEEEAETLPADEVMGDPPTAHTSAPSSQSSSGDEASDNEGEIHINDPSSHIIDNANLDGKDQPAQDESGEEDGGTPQSAASVPSYAFDCPTSNAHSTAESCGKSPGLFSLENEEQLLEDAKDPCLVQELTMSAATGHIDDHLGSPVALLPLRHHEENDKEEEDEEEEEVDPDEEQYLLRGKSDIGFPGILSSTGPLEADGHLSPHHHHTSGEDSESQPPYFTAICDKTDNALAGNV